MTSHYDLAKIAYSQNSSLAWVIGEHLAQAVDVENRSIRDFCRDVNGNTDKEDTFTRYANAWRFKKHVEPTGFDCDLEITFWSEAWVGLNNGWDIEDVLETMLFAQEHRKGVRWFRVQKAKATGTDTTMAGKLRQMRNGVEKLASMIDFTAPEIHGACSSINVVRAEHAMSAFSLISEIEPKIDELSLMLEILEASEEIDL